MTRPSPRKTSTALLESTREALYAVADRAPALSAPLSIATRAITETLAQLAEPASAHEQLLTAGNAIAAARHHSAGNRAIQLELAAAFAVIEDLRGVVRTLGPTAPRPRLRLVHTT
jgi:hypothetical protein